MSSSRREYYCEKFLFNLLEKFNGEKYKRELGDFNAPPYFEDNKDYIVVNANSEASSRRMPIDQWEKYLGHYDGETFVFVGAPKEREWVSQVAAVVQKNNEVVNLAGKTSIVELLSVLTHSRFVITNDSGPAHLAAYAGARVLTWIGAADEENTVMLSKNQSDVKVFKVDLPCAPCLKNSCPLNTIDCLTKVDMNEVYQSSKKYV